MIGFVGFEQVNAFDLAGPAEVFATANALFDGATPYRLMVVAPDAGMFGAESGLRFVAEASLSDAPAFDTIVVPGGCGLRERGINARVGSWLAGRLAQTRRIATVCTGIFGLAPTGALDGRPATTHWRFQEQFRAAFPAVELDCERIYVQSGNLYTSGGISAGVDLALALVAEDLGPKLAFAIAREMLVPMVRTGVQAQFSEPLRAQTRAPLGLAQLVAWIGCNLGADLSVEALASRAGLCARQLARRFREELGETPAAFVLRLRLDAARDALAETDLSIEYIAFRCGFVTADGLRRAFQRRYGMAPSDFRHALLSETVG